MISALSSADCALARRIEHADAETNRSAVLTASPGAVAESFAGGHALFAGAGSPLTHAVGIGMDGAVPHDELEALEEFFRSHDSPVLIDLCPLADESVLRFVQNRPYRIIELNNILARGVTNHQPMLTNSGISVRRAERHEQPAWSHVIARGFSGLDDPPEAFTKLLSGMSGPSAAFLGYRGEELAGGAAMGWTDGVASFFGDATLMSARGHGLQSAMINARLAHAADLGCDLAISAVVPGSGSHRNYLRAGFQLVYMRVNLIREW